MHWGSQDNSVPGHQQQFHGGGFGMPQQNQQQQQSNERIPFDSSNFPALSGQPPSQNSGAPNRMQMGGGDAISGTIGQPFSGSVVRTNSRFPTLPQQPQQHNHFGSEFVAQKEDFPVLSSAVAPGGPGKSVGPNQQPENGTSQILGANSGNNGSSVGIVGNPIGAGGSVLGGMGANVSIPSTGQSQSGQTLPLPPQQPQQQASAADTVSKEVRFGLLGLLEAIRMTDKDLNTLALGNDLTTFGLNLNATDCLFTNFCSPYAEPPSSSAGAGAAGSNSGTGQQGAQGEGGSSGTTGSAGGGSAPPPFPVPASYFTPPPSLKLEQFAKMQLETLFYMFYVLPRDMMQALAAQELYRREWKYHTDLRVWVKGRSLQEQQQIHPGVQWIYFDLGSWDIKPFQFPPSPGNGGGAGPQKSPMYGAASHQAMLDESDVRVVAGAQGGASAIGGLPPSASTNGMQANKQ